ncbi:hypothetical protein MB9_0759 [Methanobacterium formicicum]|uniref:Uncharacterized protein n=1 Tax=Methanobacterium formicicum TaxID=2162 RepID=A0A0S4FN11_METFO|nr:hypothetical protein MB9_0759 [Methanobacterium formicicum]
MEILTIDILRFRTNQGTANLVVEMKKEIKELIGEA